jgi:hypothetical protein
MPPGENSRDFRTVLFVQHPAKNALNRPFPRSSFVACARTFSNSYQCDGGGHPKVVPCFQLVRLRPSRSAGVSEGAMRLRRGPRGLGTRLKGVFTRRIRHLSC